MSNFVVSIDHINKLTPIVISHSQYVNYSKTYLGIE